MSQPPVFISYPRDGSNGQALARELYERLAAANIAAFLDEENILFGDRWIQTLVEGVKSCQVMLSVVSPAAHDRLWVEKEYIAASEQGTLIIPVLADEGSLPFQIKDLQAARLYGDYKESHWPRLLARIHKYLPDIADTLRNAEIVYLDKLLHDNEERALRFASKVYTPLAGEYHKVHRRVAVACISPLLKHRKRIKYMEPTELGSECTEHEDVIAAFNTYQRLVILGEPGAGKTFSLWRIAAGYAQQALAQAGQLLPIVIPLNRWDRQGLSLHDFVLEQMGELAWHFDSLYQARRLLPLFDALNEIPFDQREEKLPQIRKWLNSYTIEYKYTGGSVTEKIEYPVVITCRLRDYRGPLEQELDRLTIEQLDPPRIHDFLHNYFYEDEAAHALADKLFWELAGGDEVLQEWKEWEKNGRSQQWYEFWQPKEYWGDRNRTRYLNDPRSLMKLATNPYLLTQMVVIYSEPPHELPQSRYELFSTFVEDLIYREMEAKAENYYCQVDQQQLQVELRQLAWQLQSRTGSQEETRTVLPRSEAEQTMPLARLEFAAAASLLELTRDSVRFSHQLLQEFFTAKSFRERRAKGLKASDLWSADRWWEPNGWEEAAKLAAEYEADGVGGDARPFLQWLAAGNPKLAAEIVINQQLLDGITGFRKQWQASITDVVGYPNFYERHNMSKLLARLDWDNRPGIGLNTNGVPDIDWVSVGNIGMSRYLVTNQQFQAFIEAGDGYNNDRWWANLRKPDFLHESKWKEGNRPAEQVDWYEAMAFCRWLSYRTGLDIRLPTEEQWEKTARYPDDRKYPWGNSFKSELCNAQGKLGETSAVGIYPNSQSHLGLMDMAGNLWEWCLNKYSKPEMIDIDLSNDSRVVRGGSWHFSSGSYRSSVRRYRPPYTRDDLQGFRVVFCLRPH